MVKRIKFICKKCGVSSNANINTNRASCMLCSDCFGKNKDTRKNELNNLTGKEWARFSKSVEHYLGTRTEKQRQHGACFPLSLAEQQIRIYTKRDQLVFDPFMGVGTTAEACEKIGRKSIGIELNNEFVELSKRDIKDKKKHKIICADIRDMLKYIDENSIHFQITSPPYANLLKTVNREFAFKWKEHSTLNSLKNPVPYSKNDKDLGNLPYNNFLTELESIFLNTFKVLIDGSYAVWVVKDYRDLDNKKPFVNFHSDVIRVAENAGLTLWDIRIYDQTKFRPLVVLGYPSKNYYLNIGHSYLLVFRKYVNGKYATKTNRKGS